MCLQNVLNAKHSIVLTFGKSTTGSAMCLVIAGRLRKESCAGNGSISSVPHDRPWVPSLFPDDQGWALQAHIYTLSSFPYKSIALPSFPVLCSPWQAIRRMLAAAGMFEEGCCGCGGETWRERWLPRQAKGDVETDGCMHREQSLCGEQPVWGTRCCFPLAVQAGLLLWAIT